MDIDIISPTREWQALSNGYRVDVQMVIFSDSAARVPASALFRDGDH